MKREIGSEFSTLHAPQKAALAAGEAHLLCGRGALWFILEDLAATRPVKRVWLPAYCCESMVQPFVQKGVDIRFYPVTPKEATVPALGEGDALLLLDFFGYENEQNREIACRAQAAGAAVIYDATHKLDGHPAVQAKATYSFCSFRKWFYCNDAVAIKHTGAFLGEVGGPHSRYTALRDTAAGEKARYLAGEGGDKAAFLTKFAAAEQLLEQDYAGYAGQPVAFDMAAIRARRRENAAYLIEKLKGLPGLRLWRDRLGEEDTPLFVPILLEPARRDELRAALIRADIYCPVHWPRPPFRGADSDLYSRELSLVCDQRYTPADMERIVRVIQDYFNR